MVSIFVVMGAGFAKQVRSNFPEAYEADLTTVRGDVSKLGSFSAARVVRGDVFFVVVNAYTQFDWRGQGVKVDYDAVRSVFRRIKNDFSGQRIGYPLIGAGLAGGDWAVVSKIIDDELAGENHSLVVWRAGV